MPGFWLNDPAHRRFLAADAAAQLDVFGRSLRASGGFHVLGLDGQPLPDPVQELHTTTRMVHAFALGHLAGHPGCNAVVDHGLRYLARHHRDHDHGGYLWALTGDEGQHEPVQNGPVQNGPVQDGRVEDGRKLAYGHVFVLLAGASARMAGHPDADRLIDDVWAVLEARFWDADAGLFREEFNRDWTAFSTYRGMNANMHGVEALLAAYEATGRADFLARAGRILGFFLRRTAGAQGFRVPEHYTQDWQIDRGYGGDPMFRPAGTTPGHSFEWARLLLQWWDLAGRPEDGSPALARAVMERALTDAWDEARGGFVYTLGWDARPDVRARYWWPVTEALGVLAAFLKLEARAGDEVWYRRIWRFAAATFVDPAGGWYPEVDEAGQPVSQQFKGKPDIYHALQADLFALAPGLSRVGDGLRALRPLGRG